MDPISPPLHVAIIINNPPGTEFWHDIKQWFISSFNAVCADAKLVFFDPVEKAILPDLAKFHLVILSGGKADASASDPWIIREMEYVQSAVKSALGAKFMGICWGHQLIHRALGGDVGPVSDGPVVSSMTMSPTFRVREQTANQNLTLGWPC
jgi:GMP synthase-like glutamine amidotransferase